MSTFQLHATYKKLPFKPFFFNIRSKLTNSLVKTQKRETRNV